MSKAYKVFRCPTCKRDVTAHKDGRKDFCNKCNTEVKLRCWGLRFRIQEEGKVVHKNMVGYRTEKDANDAYLQFMSTYKKPTNPVGAPIYKLKIEDIFPVYLKVKASEVKQSTYYDIIKCFNTNILPYFTGRIVTTITTQDIRDWQDFLVSKGYALKTKQKNRAYLNNLFDYLHKEYGIENVVERVKGFSKKLETIAPVEMNIIEPSEYQEFEKAVDDLHDKTMFNILYLCQTRKGEMCALTWNDWLGDNQKLNIDKTFSRISFDGTQDQYPVPKASVIKEFNVGQKSKYIVHSPKSTNSVRKIDLPDSTISYLQQLYDIRSKEQGFSNDEFIFGKRGSFMNYTTLSNRFEKYKMQSNISQKVRVHDLRHSGVSLLINTYQNSSSNINTLQLEFIIAERIGDTVEQVIKTYGHLFKGMQSIVAKNIKL